MSDTSSADTLAAALLAKLDQVLERLPTGLVHEDTVAVIEARADADVAVIEARADADVAVIEANADAVSETIETVDDLDAELDDSLLPAHPETDHWFFRDLTKRDNG